MAPRGVGTPLLLLALALTACTGDGGDGSSSGPSERPDQSSVTPGDPRAAEPTTAPLDWKPTDGGPEDRRIVGDEWTSLVDDRGASATFTRPDDDSEVVIDATGRRQISDVLMDDDHAVVVAEDPREGAPDRQPPTAQVLDLEEQSISAVADPPPGASFALHDGRLRFATFDRSGAYCAAEVDLASGDGDFTTCAEPRTGITRITTGEHGTAWLSFDDQRPVSCRTPLLLEGDTATPVAEAEECSAWDVAATPDGAVWSEVPDERRAEEGVFRAVADGATYDLGEGTTGTLVPCADSVWWVSDPSTRRDPARLMRWTPDARLEVAYETRARGNAFIGAPECAGDVLTLSAFGRGGDEQVWAEVD